MAIDFSKLKNRTQTSYETREANSRINALNLPENIELFSLKENTTTTTTINIIPYIIATDKHPLVAKGEASIGEPDYLLDFYRHKNIGPEKVHVVCINKTYGKPCPICEALNELNEKNFDSTKEYEDAVKMLKPSRRAVYNITLDDGTNIQIFKISHFQFERELINEAKANSTDGILVFADPEVGKSITFRFNGNFGEFSPFRIVSFNNRPPISQRLLNKAISLDEYLQILSYDELYKCLHGNINTTITKTIDIKTDKKSIPQLKNENIENRNKCPFGHKFGEDCDSTDDCQNMEVCTEEIWNECSNANKQML